MKLTLVCFAAVPISSELHLALHASARHAWVVPVSDMRGALRALYEVTIMQLSTHKCISVILNN